MSANLQVQDREVTVRKLPIGIEPSDFHERLRKKEVQEKIRDIRDQSGRARILIGIDRLDYIKGIPQKLHALDEFFQEHPDQVGRVVLVQVVIPSRANLEVNQKLRVEVQELVGKINGKHGTQVLDLVRHIPSKHYANQTVQQAKSTTSLYTSFINPSVPTS